jgi:hypothetical protein
MMRIQSYTVTFVTKVRYLAYSTSIVSSNFMIWGPVYTPNTIAAGGHVDYTLGVTINTTGSYYSGVWIVGVNGAKVGTHFGLAVSFSINPNILRVTNPDTV